MTYDDCITYNHVKYCRIESGRLIVGNNSTTNGNAIESGFNLTSLEIPEAIDNEQIEEIGQRSFTAAKDLVSVNIKARITQINFDAFYCCMRLSYINIPSSTQFIGQGVLSLKNYSTQTTTSNGTVRIIFEYPASVKYIGMYGIERKENMIVYYFGKNKPTFAGGTFTGVTNKTVFALKKMDFNGVKTTLYGIDRITCKCQRSSEYTKLAMIILLATS